MTEGPRHEKPMCVRLWFEVGHCCEARPQSCHGRALSLDWRVWVRGVRGRDISAFVQKIVFYLHPSSAFVYPKRVIQEPPYEVLESGSSSIEIPIHLYLKYSKRPKKIKLKYFLNIDNITKSITESTCVYYDFKNPSEMLQEALIRGGGEVISHSGTLSSGLAGRSLLVISGDKSHRHPRAPARRCKFVEPAHCVRKAKASKLQACPKCGDCPEVDFKRMLKAVAMSDSEIKLVSKLYTAFTGYEKSADAIVLPPFSDPIYQVPELPASLRGSPAGAETDCFKT